MTQAKAKEQESERALGIKPVPRKVMHQHMIKEKIKRQKKNHMRKKEEKLFWLLCSAQTHV